MTDTPQSKTKTIILWTTLVLVLAVLVAAFIYTVNTRTEEAVTAGRQQAIADVVDLTVAGAQAFNYTCWYAMNQSGNLSALMTDCQGNVLATIVK